MVHQEESGPHSYGQKSVLLTSTYPVKDCVTQGDTAPPFTADAFAKGRKRQIQLADYRGKWLILVFYSSDFTFV